jgi:hypothetical protein
MNHHFKVIFDITEAGYRQWYFPAVGLIGVVLGIGLIILRRFFYPGKSKSFRHRFFPYFIAGFSAIWTLIAFTGTYFDYLNLRNSLRNGQFQLVEGVITNFVPPKKGTP